MKQKKIWILAGAPGSGKSTYIKTNLKENDAWITREHIYEQLRPSVENCFLKDRCHRTFYKDLNSLIENSIVNNIYIDAPHLTEAERRQVITKINNFDYIKEINCIHINTPLNECLRRNSLRKGYAEVSKHIVENMYLSFNTPTKNEGFDHYYVVDYQTDEIKEVNI